MGLKNIYAVRGVADQTYSPGTLNKRAHNFIELEKTLSLIFAATLLALLLALLLATLLIVNKLLQALVHEVRLGFRAVIAFTILACLKFLVST